mgnify:FL=1
MSALPDATADAANLAVLVLAAGRAPLMHELTEAEALPALPLVGRLRVVDLALGAVARAGLWRVLVALQHRPATLLRHLPARWGTGLDLRVVEGRAALGSTAGFGDAEGALRHLLGLTEAATVVVVPAARAEEPDLGGLLAAHRAGGAPATVARGEGVRAAAFDRAWLRGALTGRGLGAVWEAARAAGAPWDDPGPEGPLATLDDLRLAALRVAAAPPPLAAPLAAEAPAGVPRDRLLSLEAGGLRLWAPRLGARRPGRWTVLEDTAVLPGGRVSPGARLSRCLVAPGAVVPSTLTVGDDPEEDARWFRVTPEGTTLITTAMLARRAAARMRAQGGPLLTMQGP